MSALLSAASGHIALPRIDYYAIAPELILLGGAVLTLLVSSMVLRPLRATVTTTLSVMTGLASLCLSLVQWYQVSGSGGHVTIGGSVVKDGFSALVSVLVSCAVIASALVVDGWMRREEVAGPELQVLMLTSASGAMIMGAANDLIVVFLGLEIMSIALYVLVALNPRRSESGEASLKYFVLGAFSSAVFAYGIALTYGATGTSNLPQIADYLARNVLLHDGLLLAGLAFLLVGFGFKVAAVPFHLWTPDVYQGSPSPITGFMAAIAKAGGFAALLRVFVSSFGLLRSDWQPAVWVIAAITLLLGAVVAVVQRDIKRMLAYSSINHAGFVLLGLQAATARGIEGSLYYLFVYTFMVIGSFAVVTIVGGRGDTRHDLDSYRGLSATSPLLAGSFAILLIAQAGIPFTTGFLAKLEVVSASVGAGSTALAVLAMVSAAITAFFYLRVILYMYTPTAALGIATGEVGAISAAGFSAQTEPTSGEGDKSLVGSIGIAIAICVAVTVIFGIWPAPVVDFAHKASLLFIGR